MDLRQIKNLMKEFEDSTIHKLEINDKDFSIKLEKEEKQYVSTAVQTVPTAASQVMTTPTERMEEVTEQESTDTPVKAPLVGTFYVAPSPDSAPFVKVGDTVNAGDVLFIIEAMKVMNEITAPVSGKITKINVNDAMMVEFGQVVMEIKE